MDMIKLCYQCSSGTTPGLGPDKPAPGLSSAATAMTQMTARTVTSEAQPGLARRDPATAPAAGPCRSGHLITCCLPNRSQVPMPGRPLMHNAESSAFSWRMMMPVCAYSCVIDAINAAVVNADVRAPMCGSWDVRAQHRRVHRTELGQDFADVCREPRCP